MYRQTDQPLKRLSLLLAMFLITSIAVFGQSVTSGLTGNVSDSQGAVIPGAEVLLTEPATGSAKTVVTDSDGNYSFQEIKPGTYQIKISKQGFSSYIADNVLVENLQIRRVDAELKVGGTEEIVTINAGAAVITTEGGTIISSFDKRRIADNPSIDTYPTPNSLFTTLPGVQGNGRDLKVSGQNSAQQTIGLDGVINDRHGEQNNNINFYEEATITTVNATAENPRVVNYNLVSKRGQNQFRGSAYYKRYDSNFNARPTFAPTKTYQVQHEAQAELSGRIWKDKTFFYASWFYHNIPTGIDRAATVPSVAMRAGDFSNLLAGTSPVFLKDPLSTSPCTATNQSGCLRDPSRATPSNPTGLNIIPANRISAVSLAFQKYFPLANDGAQRHNWVHPFASDYYRASFPFIRVDHNFSSKNSIYGKWVQRKTPFVLDSNQMPGFFWTRLRDHSQFSVTDTHILTGNLINSFTFGWSRDFVEDGEETAGQKPFDGNEVLSETGLQGMNPGGLTGAGFPNIGISQISRLSLGQAGGVKNDDDTFSFANNVTWTRGSHVIKFGGNLIRFKTFVGEVPNYGFLDFNGFASRASYADFLLGIPVTSRRNSPRSNRARKITEMGLFISDSYKVTPNLTVDLGIRWDYYGLPTFNDGLQYNFDPLTGSVIIPEGTRSEVDPLYPASIPIVEGQVVPNADKGNFRPRIAAAYRFGDDFVLRGGYGAFTERFSRFYTELALGEGPFSTFDERYDNAIVNGIPRFSFPSPFPSTQGGLTAPGVQSVSGVPLKNDDGVIHQFNVSVEKEIFGLGWRGSYIGSRGTGLRAFAQLNAQPITDVTPTNPARPLPYTRFARNGVSYIRDDYGSKFDSLQFQVQRRRGDLTFDAHYTYSLNRDNINNSPNPFEPTSQWALDGLTRKHLAVVTTRWALPIGKGRQFLSEAPAVVDAIIGGWRTTTVSYFGSGRYFTPFVCGFGGALLAVYGESCVRPDELRDGNLPRGERSTDRWFDQSAFAAPQRGTYGNALASSLEGPGLHVHHLGLSKVFSISERFRLTYTFSVSNIFNTPNFAMPTGDLACSPVPTAACGARIRSTLGVGGPSPENSGHRTGAMALRFDF
ncbi:MAG: TonB-dependent receptor [Acidobacteriota bacterium]|nr:TonB-dependent receptor [Acidobacteriota bacterium]